LAGQEDYRLIHRLFLEETALALLLINANYVTQMDIVQSVQKHMLDIIYDLATWTKEPFIFEEGELPATDRITVPIELENVIIEISRLTQQHKRLRGAVSIASSRKERRN
jgi:hypothetical protein